MQECVKLVVRTRVNLGNAFCRKAEPLKDKVQRCKDLLNDNDAWVCQQQLQKIYQQVLILDLEYALDKKVEQELWSLGFKNYIVTLQSQAKDRKNPKRGESQALLSWCLEAASGFYLTLLQEICTVFDLDLPFRRYGFFCTGFTYSFHFLPLKDRVCIFLTYLMKYEVFNYLLSSFKIINLIKLYKPRGIYRIVWDLPITTQLLSRKAKHHPSIITVIIA